MKEELEKFDDLNYIHNESEENFKNLLRTLADNEMIIDLHI